MKMKKILFFISFNILILSNIRGMESDSIGLKKEISHAAIQHGDPDAPAYCIISPEVLQRNPVFQKLREKANEIKEKAKELEILKNNPIFQTIKEQAQQLEETYDIIIEDLILMPQEQQENFLEDIQQNHPEFLEISQIISSTIFNNDDSSITPANTEQLQQQKQLKELCKSIRLSETSVDSTISDNQTSTTSETSGLSWGLWYQLKMYGEPEALKYALDNNQFDPNNIDHKDLLKKNINNCKDAKKSINSLMQQQCNELKGTCCYTMVALLDQFSIHVSTLHSEIEKIVTEQKQKQETLYKQFADSYEQQNQQLMELTKIRHQHKIKIDKINQEKKDARKKQLKNTEILFSDLSLRIADISAIATRVKRYEKVVTEIAQQFAIENNK